MFDYLKHLEAQDRSRATINRRLAAALGLVTWSIEVASEKVERYRDTRGPGLDGVRKILAGLADRHDPKAVRGRAIIRLLHDLALRRGELVRLDLEHLDLEAATVAVRGKGREGRELLTLPHETAEALQTWVALRGGGPGPLFTNVDRAGKGQRLITTSVYRLVAELGQRVGVRARPYSLRHSAITTALNLNGGDIGATQRFSRHLDLRTLRTTTTARTSQASWFVRRQSLEHRARRLVRQLAGLRSHARGAASARGGSSLTQRYFHLRSPEPHAAGPRS